MLKLHEEKLDSSVAPGLKSELITLHAEGSRNIILDLGEVKYTDSSGLSALLVGNRIVQEDGGIFVLSALSEHTMKLMRDPWKRQQVETGALTCSSPELPKPERQIP